MVMHRFLPIVAAFFVLCGIFACQQQIQTAIQKWQHRDSAAIGELSSQAYMDRVLASDGEFDPSATKGVWFNKEVAVPNDFLASVLKEETPSQVVLGDSTVPKKIEVDLTTQKLYAYEGNSIKFIFDVSSGLPWTPTVTGDFNIWAKVRSQRMRGGSVADGSYYDLPNVPYVMFFYKGYSLHGAYWHHDFGHPRSHGCVNLSIDDAKTLYYWANPEMALGQNFFYSIPKSQSTEVIVHGTTPTNLN